MQRKFETVLSHLMTCFTRLIDGMSSPIIPKHFFIQGLHAHFDSSNTEFAPELAVCVGHIFRPGFYGQSDNSMGCTFIFFERFCDIL